MRPGHGRKARCSSLMTLLSMRCGRMLHPSDWFSSWMCGTLNWPPNRDAAFLQFSRDLSKSGRSLSRESERLYFCLSWSVELQVWTPWLLVPWTVDCRLLRFSWIRQHGGECLPAGYLESTSLCVSQDSTDQMPGFKGTYGCFFLTSQRYVSS